MIIENFEQFAESLLNQLTKFGNEPISQHTMDKIDDAISLAFFRVEEKGDILMPADGMRITGGRAVREGDNNLRIVWVTDFYPQARFDQSGTCTPLGFYQEFDLYIAHQDGLPATLIARYGNGSEYLTCNPELIGDSGVSSHGQHFEAALTRARFLGVNW